MSLYIHHIVQFFQRLRASRADVALLPRSPHGRQSWVDAAMLALLLFPVCCALITAVGFILGIGVTRWHPWLALLTFALVCRYYFSGLRQAFVTGLAVAGLVTLAALVLSCFFYDGSYDTASVYTPTTLALVEGWNPVWHPEVGQWNPAYAEHAFPQLSLYPKANSMINACVFQWIPILEGGKFSRLVFIVLSFLIAGRVLGDAYGLKSWRRHLLAFVVAVNPISLNQWQCGYIDGLMGSLFAIIVMAALGLVATRDRFYEPFLCGSLMLSVNLKQTGLVMMVPLMGTMGLSALLVSRDWMLLVRPALLGVVGAVVIGVSPYITSALLYGSPLHPFVTDSAHKAEQFNLRDHNDGPPGAKEFLAQDRISKFVKSNVLSRPSNFPYVRSWPLTHWRFPPAHNWRLGGFGTLFGAVLLLTPLLAVGVRRNRLCVGIVLGLLFSVLILPEPWWARYIPQLWLLPALLCITLVSESRSRLWAVIAALAIALMVCNSGLVMYGHGRQQLKDTLRHYVVADRAKSMGASASIVSSTCRVTEERRLAEAGLESVPVGAVADFRLNRYTRLILPTPPGGDSDQKQQQLAALESARRLDAAGVPAALRIAVSANREAMRNGWEYLAQMETP